MAMAAISGRKVSPNAWRVGEHDDRGGDTVHRDQHGRMSTVGAAVVFGGERGDVDALPIEQTPVADRDAATVDRGDRTVAGHILECRR